MLFKQNCFFNMKKRWKFSRHSVYNTCYHIIWCTKYRRNVLQPHIQEKLKELLNEKAKGIGVKIESMETMEDHIHIFVSANPTLAPHYIVQQFKGFTSHELRKHYPEVKSKLPTLWTRSYYIETIGHISEDTIKRYIENQKNV